MSWSKLKRFLFNDTATTEKQDASGRDYQKPGRVPGQNLQHCLKARLRGVTHRKPALVADEVGVHRENALANSFAFPVLQDDVNPESDDRNHYDPDRKEPDQDADDGLKVVTLHF